MTIAKLFSSKAILTLTALLGVGICGSACAPHPKPIPTWGGSTLPTYGEPPTASTTMPVQPPAQPSLSSNGRSTFTQGCTGSFSVRDARTNREISNGRAYNSGSGLIALDAQGRQIRAVSSALSQSVTFLPDCTCRLGGNQSGDLPSTHQFAATPPKPAVCAGG